MNERQEVIRDRVPTTKNAFAAGGAISALAALVGASCCILPIFLVNFGVGSALVANLAFFATNKTYFLAASAVFIALGAGAAFWKGRRPGARTLVLLAAALLLTATAYVLPWFEGRLLRYLFS